MNEFTKTENIKLIIFKNKKVVIWLLSITLTIALAVGGFAIYVSDYYRADMSSIEAFSSKYDIKETVLYDGAVAYGDLNAKYGFIFYPGGKVEYTAYEPLMYQLASKGVLCVLLEMPFNLAVLNMNAADGILERFPYVESWYIGGHSLGGSMAAYYIEANADSFDGLILLGSYSSKELSGLDFRALSIYGSNDKVLNRPKYDECRSNLPSSFTEFEIDGGCHAYFGMYGAQYGDGTPTITAEEQIIKTSDIIIKFIAEGGE